ncbi:hypothetical protein NDU88_005414 [Pleurodeles waltl]|uniref:Uncharacterized protein n=1 Tax=Pleurodeles waltl TaxID=8319 RepID=A0AAV7UK22_PLEWA|nr:hypothetical protein NDU88_005414 [Pleurodeles waltl]
MTLVAHSKQQGDKVRTVVAGLHQVVDIGDILSLIQGISVYMMRCKKNPIRACDGLVPTTDPSVDAAQTNSAASNPEGEDPSTNPLRSPGPEWQRQELHAISAVKGETVQERRGEAAEGAVY